jgi:hypothetical protein
VFGQAKGWLRREEWLPLADRDVHLGLHGLIV